MLPRWGQYCRSKLCNVLMTAELQRRLAGRGISVYSVSPGLVATNLFSSLPWPLGPLCARIMPLVARTPAQVGHMVWGHGPIGAWP